MQEDRPKVFATNGERKQREQEAQEAELYKQMAAAGPGGTRWNLIVWENLGSRY